MNKLHLHGEVLRITALYSLETLKIVFNVSHEDQGSDSEYLSMSPYM